MLVYLVVASVTVTVILHLLLYLRRREFSSFKHIPTWLWWYPGHALMMRNPKYLNYDDPKESYFEIRTACDAMVKELGSDTIALFFFHKTFIYTTNVTIASTVLSSSKNILKPVNPNIETPNGISVFGKRGIVTEPGTEIWAHKRKTMDPAFQKKFLRVLVGEMNGLATRLCNHLDNMSCKTPTLEIYDVFMKAALEVVCRCGFNFEDEIIESEDSPINRAVTDVFDKLQEAAIAIHFYNLPWVHREGKRILKKQTDFLKSVMTKHLEHRLESIENGTDDKDDILSYIIRANMFDNKINMSDVMDDFFSFLSAGMETTAITMSVLMWHLVKDREIYDKLNDEITRVYGSKDELTFDDLNELVYLEQCIKETLRLSPPAEITSRTNSVPMNIDGYHFPKGSVMLITEYGIQHRPDIWPEPDKFDPERFDPKKKIAPFTFIPFTAGPRICIGKHFAMMEMKILISRLIREFNIQDGEPGSDKLIKVKSLTVKPKYGVYVKLERY